MAWIKVETATKDKPELIRMSRLLGCSRMEVLGLLVAFWSTCDNLTADGVFPGLTREEIDVMANCERFGEALILVGWAEETAEGFRLSNFAKHNGATAKKRAEVAARVAQCKARKRRPNAPGPGEAVTQIALPREEKRREEYQAESLTETTSATASPRVVVRPGGYASPGANFTAYHTMTEDQRAFIRAFGKRPRDLTEFNAYYAEAVHEVPPEVLAACARLAVEHQRKTDGDSQKLRRPENWLADRAWEDFKAQATAQVAETRRQATIDENPLFKDL
ncbi:MAG: hypothetical protein ACI4RT_01775 [Candidatus Spyradenecus sp.]